MVSTANDTMPILTSPGPEISPKLAAILARPSRIKQHSQLWYTTRTKLLTCSDIASVVGLNPYTSRAQVFKRKTGQTKPFRGNAATRRGTRLEPEALAHYERVTGKQLWPEDVGLTLHPEYDVLGGSPDGITLDGVLVEIKCPLTRAIKPGVVPGYYLPQVQVLLEIFDLDVAHFVQYKPVSFANEEPYMDITVVHRDRNLFRAWLPSMLEFVDEIHQFYTQRNLPVGTPIIDFDQPDPVALKRAQLQEEIGIGKVCHFTSDPHTQKSLFVMETYAGPNNPVTRVEYPLSAPSTPADHGLDAQAEADETTKFLDSLMTSLPDTLRDELRSACQAEEEQASDDSSQSGDIDEFDWTAVERRMKRARTSE
jgi:putative phage-type endonuclease